MTPAANARARGLVGPVLAAVVAAACGGGAPAVEVLRAPDGASLPQAAVDPDGRLHLVYYTGSMSSGDLWHVTRAPGAADWSARQRVNSRPYSVTGLGPVDGGQLAVGPDGRLHVTWFHRDPTWFHYARTGDDGEFEPQQTLSAKPEGGVETGSTVAVDGGGVYVFWHADPVQDADRRVYLAASRDNGKHFDPPRPVGPAAEGACGCCGLRAAADGAGAVHVSYRGAGDNVNRGMRLLTSTDGGRTFDDRLIQPWNIGACPVATTTLAAGPDGTLVAWETEGQVFVANTGRPRRAVVPAGRGAVPAQERDGGRQPPRRRPARVGRRPRLSVGGEPALAGVRYARPSPRRDRPRRGADSGPQRAHRGRASGRLVRDRLLRSRHGE